MPTLKKIILSSLMLFLFTPPAIALNSQEKGVKKLVEEAVVAVLTEGEEKVLYAINSASSRFVTDSVYLFAGSLKRITILAHPFHPELIGKDLSLMHDGHGTYINFEFVKLANEVGSGWVKYWWYRPNSSKKSPKMTYILKVPSKNLFIGGGYYLDAPDG